MDREVSRKCELANHTKAKKLLNQQTKLSSVASPSWQQRRKARNSEGTDVRLKNATAELMRLEMEFYNLNV
jgi:hypothetical protein